jgi:hypothetical protein
MRLRSAVFLALTVAQLSCAHSDGASVRAAIEEAVETGNQTGKGPWRAIDRSSIGNLSIERYEFGSWRRLILGVDRNRPSFAFALKFRVADPSDVSTLKRTIEGALRTRDFIAAFESGGSVQMERTDSGLRVIALAPSAELSWAIEYLSPLFGPLSLHSSEDRPPLEQDNLSDDLSDLTPVDGSTTAEARTFSITTVAVTGQFDRAVLFRELAKVPNFPPSEPEDASRTVVKAAKFPSRRPVSSASGPSMLWSVNLGEARHWPQAEVLAEALAWTSQLRTDEPDHPRDPSLAIATDISVSRRDGHTRIDVRDTLQDVRSATVAAAARTAQMRALVLEPEGAALWQRAGARFADRLLRAFDVPSSSAPLLGALLDIGVGPSELSTHYEDLRNRKLLVPQALRQAIAKQPAEVHVEKHSEGS